MTFNFSNTERNTTSYIVPAMNSLEQHRDMFSEISPQIYTVSSVAGMVSSALKNIRNIRLQGEISNWKISGNNIFFSINDEQATLNCCIFSCPNVLNRANILLNSVKDGLKAYIRGDINFYAKGGRITIIVREIEIYDREGELRRQFEEKRKWLEQNGYTNPSIKRPLPAFIRKVGVITGCKTEAAKDVINNILKRNHLIEILVFDAVVQGTEAPQSLMNALFKANQSQYHCDVIIVARGGGSVEDLDAFNDLNWCVYLRKSIIPVVSGVGHEGDWTLTDYVADLRCSTPTAAAVRVSSDLYSLIETFNDLNKRLNNSVEKSLQHRLENLKNKEQSLKSFTPLKTCKAEKSTIKNLNISLNNAITSQIQSYKKTLISYEHRLEKFSPEKQISSKENSLIALQLRLKKAVEKKLSNANNDLIKLKNYINEANQLTSISQKYTLLERAKNGLSESLRNKIIVSNKNLSNINGKLVMHSPVRQIVEKQKSFNDLKHRLERAFEESLTKANKKISKISQDLISVNPINDISKKSTALKLLQNLLDTAMAKYIEGQKNEFNILLNRLESRSPLRMLLGGYTITTDKNGKIITSNSVAVGDVIETRTFGIKITSSVTGMVLVPEDQNMINKQ